MYAITIAEDRSLHWTPVPDPVVKPGEVLIDVRAAALNRADLMQRAGQYPPPPGWPGRRCSTSRLGGFTATCGRG